MIRSFFYLLLAAAAIPWGFPLSARNWTELDKVHYEQNASNDGDSFHAKRNSSKYLFRLYFVDTPEKDLRYPDRVKAQADYFGLTPEQAVKGAERAGQYVENLLKDKPFTVYTRYTDARGASDKKRYYAMVKIGDRWLSELLIEQGLARVYGMGSELPDGTSERNYWARLRKLEKEAKENHRGLWATASGKVDVEALEEGAVIRLPVDTVIFRSGPPHQAVGTLPADYEVRIGPVTRPGFRKVTFTTEAGNKFVGELQESALK